MRPGDIEYVFLRLIRRFILKGRIIDSVSRFIPYYQPSIGEKSPFEIVNLYWKYCQSAGINPIGSRILEIGTGRTNGTAYEIASRGGDCTAFDPFTPLDREMDQEVFKRMTERHPHLDQRKCLRIEDLSDLPTASIDLVLSHSVLEHVLEMDGLLKRLTRVSHSNTRMIHVVDYRDHFFKYPFHFLRFSEPVWYRYLAPGDLTRARIGDHIRAFKAYGFNIDVLEKKTNIPALMKIRRNIHRDFLGYSIEDLATTGAVLLARKC